MTSRSFRRDLANVHEMHRTVMSAYPDITADTPARAHCGVLWRLDERERGFVIFVQSRVEPKWAGLPDGYVIKEPEVGPLEPYLPTIEPGRKLGFRLVANPTRAVFPEGSVPGNRGRGKPVPVRMPAEQLDWLARKGEQHGFVLPLGRNGEADIAPAPRPKLTGRSDKNTITVEPVRFDGHLVVTDADSMRAAVFEGIGRAKSYGCGLLSLRPVRATT
ncbi:type I-E CRISPR-associated protein Cas6/Cse3/CasE [Actinoalloteichus hymeniacidonis]|uniref:type I-E CRISPR-associated protein Cas6/Cse3/CasE n=1 Tax=Actinoalloteichus hymeniacidonis TaxID=340345 RepID=UPI00184D7466|nr:type I-E CRISPR-associated protein Cas6/Cse3/CasE [Actinoalloteichus hymeniacidonis]MBB5907126.1 CRISPR system Cascade subunit CasE [Actinoalloteichus hymeniacidonis]